jgi:hypothetical protein
MRLCGMDLPITGMQAAALMARMRTNSHAEAAAELKISPRAFKARFARAMAQFPYQIRNRLRETFLRKRGNGSGNIVKLLPLYETIFDDE